MTNPENKGELIALAVLMATLATVLINWLVQAILGEFDE